LARDSQGSAQRFDGAPENSMHRTRTSFLRSPIVLAAALTAAAVAWTTPGVQARMDPRGAAEAAPRTRTGPAADRYDDIIQEYARRYRVEPALVKAIINVESRFDARAVSRRGACGLMQLMPRTARAHGVRDPRNPRENVRAGVSHLRSLLDRFGNDVRLAVAAYNSGAAAVRSHRGLPPYRETRLYVARVLAHRAQYLRQAAAETLPSPA
jgi:soluble lytic murein transglycosylase-like protein